MASNQSSTISEDAFLQRMRDFVAPNPSPRNPRVSTQSSHADRIEAGYQADGHAVWGFVIYRTTYDSDADWDEFMRRLRLWTSKAMDFYNGRDVLERMAWTVIEDRERFEGADASAVRRHFREWAEANFAAEQRQTPQVSGGGDEQSPPITMGQSPRYRYYVQVDTDALRSAVHESSPPPVFDKDNQGWVKVIDKNWAPRVESQASPSNTLDSNTYEPIDGATEYDVGWVKCPFPSVMTEYYMLFRDLNGYTVAYRRPPAVIGYPWN